MATAELKRSKKRVLRPAIVVRKLRARDAMSVAKRYVRSHPEIPLNSTIESGAYLLAFKARVFAARYKHPATRSTNTLLLFWVRNDRQIVVIDDRGLRALSNEDRAATPRFPTRH